MYFLVHNEVQHHTPCTDHKVHSLLLRTSRLRLSNTIYMECQQTGLKGLVTMKKNTNDYTRVNMYVKLCNIPIPAHSSSLRLDVDCGGADDLRLWGYEGSSCMLRSSHPHPAVVYTQFQPQWHRAGVRPLYTVPVVCCTRYTKCTRPLENT